MIDFSDRKSTDFSRNIDMEKLAGSEILVFFKYSGRSD